MHEVPTVIREDLNDEDVFASEEYLPEDGESEDESEI